MIHSKSLLPKGSAGSGELSATQPPQSREQPVDSQSLPSPLACAVLKWHARLSLFNHFELLDVPEDADRTTILLGFQQAVRRFHPDQLTGEYEPLRPLAREIVSRIGTAYRVLENDMTRRQYLSSLEGSRRLGAARSSMPASRPSNPAFRPSSMPASRPSNPAFRRSSVPAGRGSVPALRAGQTPLPASAARTTFDVAETGTPEDVFAAAKIQLKRGAIEAAFVLVEQACIAEPENPRYRALHAWLRVQRGELKSGPMADGILKTLTWAARQQRTDPEIRMYRGRVLQRLGRMEEAVREFSVVASLDENNLEAVREVRLYRAREEQKASSSGVWTRLFKNS